MIPIKGFGEKKLWNTYMVVLSLKSEKVQQREALAMKFTSLESLHFVY